MNPANILALFPKPHHKAAVLTINLENQVDYQADIADPAQFATDPPITHPMTPRNFFVVTSIADIRMVNQVDAKGTYVGRTRVVLLSPQPGPGGAIADLTRTAMREHIFEILRADGTEVGTIVSVGFSGGPAPPGTGTMPPNQRGNWAIVGGTGAYLGARGQVAGLGQTGRGASMSEDPGPRRGTGNATEFVLHVIPMERPATLLTLEGPAIFHTDFHRVSAVKPAITGEILSLLATGLGATSPDVDLTQPFPLTPPSIVNAPVTVTVAGISGDIISAVGVPGSLNGYRVEFRMPANTGTGLKKAVLTAAWIDAAPVEIHVN